MKWPFRRRLTDRTALSTSFGTPSQNHNEPAFGTGASTAMAGYAADTPISDPTDDYFRRWPFAQRIARTISSRHDPSSLVVGVYGAWGEGKTSVLNFIANELQQHADIVCVKFDPWRFGDETQLLLSFFGTLADAVDRSLTTPRERLGNIIADYAAPLIPPVGLGPVQVNIADTVKQFAQRFSAIDLDQRREQIEQVLREEGKRVVVLMDDIDRLDKAEVQAVFKLVKLSASFAYTAYVLAFDEDIVAASLAERYGAGNEAAGHDFLEKIIQVPLRLPAVEPVQLRRYCFAVVEAILRDAGIALTTPQANEFALGFERGLRIRLTTPRVARRYGNALTFALPMLKGEVNPVDLMLIEGIRVFYPGLYEVIRDNSDAFLRDRHVSSWDTDQEKQRSLAVVTKGLAGLEADEGEAVRALLVTLFPRLSGLFGNTHYGRDWEPRWAAEQRITSRAYFPRYFSYTVPEGDISDSEMGRFIASLEADTVEAIADNIRALVTSQTVDAFVSKLWRATAEGLGEVASGKLAQALSTVGDVFPNADADLFRQTSFVQAAFLVQRLIYAAGDEAERTNVARAVVRSGQPMPFVAESLLHEAQARQEREEGRDQAQIQQPIPSYLALADVRDLVVDRIRGFVHEHSPIFTSHPKEMHALLRVWERYETDGEIDTYFGEIFDKDPQSVLAFLTCYLPTAQDLSTGLMGRGDFLPTSYDGIRSVVDPEIVAGALRKVYDFDARRLAESWGSTIEERVADAFDRLHTAAKKAEQPATGQGELDSSAESAKETNIVMHSNGTDGNQP